MAIVKNYTNWPMANVVETDLTDVTVLAIFLNAARAESLHRDTVHRLNVPSDCVFDKLQKHVLRLAKNNPDAFMSQTIIYAHDKRLSCGYGVIVGDQMRCRIYQDPSMYWDMQVNQHPLTVMKHGLPKLVCFQVKQKAVYQIWNSAYTLSPIKIPAYILMYTKSVHSPAIQSVYKTIDAFEHKIQWWLSSRYDSGAAIRLVCKNDLDTFFDCGDTSDSDWESPDSF